MRVLLITDWLGGIGGAERYLMGVRDGLRAAGDDVRLLTSDVGSAGDGSAEYRAHGSERLAAKAMLQLANPFAVRAVRHALREFRPDTVLLNMFEHQLSPAILAPLGRVPTVLTVTDYKGICPISSKLLPDGTLCRVNAGLVCWRSGCVSLAHWIRDRPRYALIRAGRKRLRRVLACSRWMQRELALAGVESEHLTLPVPAPGAGFRREPSAHPTFVYSGRLDRTKGLPLLLRAFAHARRSAPTAALRIVGAGPDRSALEELTRTLGLESAVTFRGWIAPDAVEQELTDAWAAVVPSQWAEPLGLVALEAIVRGIPVIASAAGGLGETVEHGVSGLLFQNGDQDALAQHLAAVAAGRTFGTHVVADDVVQRMREIHSPARYIAHLRGVFTTISAAHVATTRAPRPPLPV